ncbi:cytochrome b-c1 complex subunit 10, partial [Neopelma chrysocephalum]|uniref:cytochrome b-c1 complex subunit 10 n=1 Tax=Neopelma chrysocephalum TaxID=114329 RepID=UPI000FCD08F7
ASARQWRRKVVHLCVCLFFRTPTILTWGGVAGVGVIWATDWKLILQYVPYVGGKYKTED